VKLDVAFLDHFTETIGPVGKSLGMLIRPAFVAAPGKTFVWGDWSAIEARVLPWLAASPGAEKKLDIFRASDSDPSKPDVYVSGAAVFVNRDPQELWNAYLDDNPQAKKLRQSHGKVPELSLGFGGAKGALMKMAINYHVYVDEVEAQHMVDVWREANQWAKEFWGAFYVNDRDVVTKATGLWGAANMAIRNPGEVFSAGRVAYTFDSDYLGGTLFCALPCGRLLTYPDCRVRTRLVKDKETGEERQVTALWFRKGYGWSALWYGKLAENVTQATAGSILRETLVELEKAPEAKLGLWETVGHTHDEAVLEVDVQPDIILAARAHLKARMQDWKPDWRLDLPLVAEITECDYYTKAFG
jgi:hypothetical protein